MSTAGQDRRRLEAWAYLSRVAEGPCSALIGLIGECRGDPVEARRRIEHDRGRLDGALARATHARYGRDSAAADLAVLHRLGGRLVTRDSPEWPSRRLDPLLEDGGDPDGAAPVALWTVGELGLARLDDAAVAIVGTRAASGYGEHVASELAGDAAEEGYAVVSGAAYGVDGTAHRAALAAGGTTVAVLACGVDRAYPAGHARLLREIAVRGAVVSEYPPGTVPGRHRFLARNRLVAGLADATVVVEAGMRSGAINTARWADRMSRALLAVPGPVTASTSAGCHHLMRTMNAQIATDFSDVITLAAPLGTEAVPRGAAAVAARKPARPTDDLTLVELTVHDALPAHGARDCGALAEAAGIPVPQVMGALAVLELRGLVRRGGAGWERCVGQEPAPGR